MRLIIYSVLMNLQNKLTFKNSIKTTKSLRFSINKFKFKTASNLCYNIYIDCLRFLKMKMLSNLNLIHSNEIKI